MKLTIKHIYYDGLFQIKGRAYISKSYLYISRDKSRSYWNWNKYKYVRPKITFNKNKLFINVGKNRIVCKNVSQFEQAKELLL
jgi:hypothetical protein